MENLESIYFHVTGRQLPPMISYLISRTEQIRLIFDAQPHLMFWVGLYPNSHFALPNDSLDIVILVRTLCNERLFFSNPAACGTFDRMGFLQETSEYVCAAELIQEFRGSLLFIPSYSLGIFYSCPVTISRTCAGQLCHISMEVSISQGISRDKRQVAFLW